MWYHITVLLRLPDIPGSAVELEAIYEDTRLHIDIGHDYNIQLVKWCH